MRLATCRPASMIGATATARPRPWRPVWKINQCVGGSAALAPSSGHCHAIEQVPRRWRSGRGRGASGPRRGPSSLRLCQLDAGAHLIPPGNTRLGIAVNDPIRARRLLVAAVAPASFSQRWNFRNKAGTPFGKRRGSYLTRPRRKHRGQGTHQQFGQCCVCRVESNLNTAQA